MERADPSVQDLRLTGSMTAHVTRAKAVCVQLPPPPEAEFSAEILLELKQGRFLLMMAARPYQGPRMYQDASAGAVISLQRWQVAPAEAAARPLAPSSFSVDVSGLTGRVDAAQIPMGSGIVGVAGRWRCQPTG